jgi:dihydroflavonol-4-reductase
VSSDSVVFLTGATGFIGGRLAAALSARGHRLRCLVRSPDRAAHLEQLGAELIAGDVTDEAALERGMREAMLAYHIAGAYDIGVVDAAAMRRTNVDGTRAFLNVLERSSVARAVYVSTTAVLEPARADAKYGAETLMQPPYATLYQHTKAEAHRRALDAQKNGAPLVIVCPAYVYGPQDSGPAGRYVQDLLRHRIPGLSTKPAWFSYVHVDDVVAGMIAAGERGVTGALYVLSGESMNVNEFTKRAVAIAGTWGPPLRFPPFLVRVTGQLLDAVSRASGVRLPISRELSDLAANGVRYLHDHSRATTDLGYEPRSLAEGLPETVRDARERLGSDG